jgi:hypothetical protein
LETVVVAASGRSAVVAIVVVEEATVDVAVGKAVAAEKVCWREP